MRAILKDNRLKAFLLLTILFIFLFYASLQFISALLGAVIIFALINPINKKLKKNFSKRSSAIIALLISILIIIVPLTILIISVNNQVVKISQNPGELTTILNSIEDLLPFQINKQDVAERTITFLSNSIGPLFSNVLRVAIIFFLMYFILYYLFKEEESFIKKVKEILPFDKKNSEKIINLFYSITYATIWGSIIIAIVQGTLLSISFAIVGLPAPIFWGFITAILSFFPVIGSPLVWGPAALWLLVQQNFLGMAIILGFGIIITFIDNIIRPITNKKFGEVHPLVSIIGIFVGIAQFGFIGIFIGPVLISYLIIFWKIYKEEYLKND